MAESIDPKISIITVCYNESKESIQATFKSICTQTYENREWIVIDGGSKQETLTAINDYRLAIDRFVSEPDSGVYNAMNKGLALATGDFVVFMNVGDSFYTNKTIEDVVACVMENESYDCYYGDIVIENQNNIYAVPQIRKVNKRILRYSMVCHQAIFARKILFDKVGCFDEHYKIVADKDWVLRTIKAGARWLFLDMFICYYDRNGISSNVVEREIEASRFVSNNFSFIESQLCFPFIKYRNIKQRMHRILKCTYKGLKIFTMA